MVGELLLMGWSEQASLRRWHLNGETNNKKQSAMWMSGGRALVQLYWKGFGGMEYSYYAKKILVISMQLVWFYKSGSMKYFDCINLLPRPFEIVVERNKWHIAVYCWKMVMSEQNGEKWRRKKFYNYIMWWQYQQKLHGSLPPRILKEENS